MGELIEDGLWRDIMTPTLPRGRPALFCDRDGTLIENIPYNADPARVRPIPEAILKVRDANAAGYAVIVVTNQSGVGRRMYDWDAVAAVQARMYELFAIGGARFDAVYAAGHAPPDAGGPAASDWRKPAPGMLLKAAEELGLDLAHSLIAGDGAHDLAAGRAAGLARGLLVPTGYGASDDERRKAEELRSDGFEVAFGPMSELSFGGR